MDLTVNGNAQDFLNAKFGDWYANQITRKLENGEDAYEIEVETTLTVMKPIHAHWIIGLYDHLRKQPGLIKNGFKMAGIADAITKDLDEEDPFVDLDFLD